MKKEKELLGINKRKKKNTLPFLGAKCKIFWNKKKKAEGKKEKMGRKAGEILKEGILWEEFDKLCADFVNNLYYGVFLCRHNALLFDAQQNLQIR